MQAVCLLGCSFCGSTGESESERMSLGTMSEYKRRRTMMVDTQVRPSDVTSFPIIDAMLTIPRETFVPDALKSAAYAEEHLNIGGNRFMLDPRTFAKMLEAIDVGPSDLVLDVACGLGYSSAIIAHMAEAVVAVEDHPDRVSDAEAALAEAEVDNVAVIEGDLGDGAPKHGPYDAIVVNGAVETLPDSLTQQLKTGGRIVAIFQEGRLGTVRLGLKTETGLNWRNVFNANAPLLSGFSSERAFAL